MNKFLISNNFYFVNEIITKEIKDIDFLEFNYLKISEKTDIDLITNFLESLPFSDTKKVLLIEVEQFSIKELKEILSNSNENTQIIAVYYLKNKLDKVDTKLSNLFKNNGFTILKSDKVNLELVDKILKSKNIPVSATTFIDADNMDVVLNDIEKISLLDEEELINVKKYISESFDSNIFELINSILLGDLDEALNKYSHLKENPVAINRIVLKQLDQIRIIKSYPSSFKSELSKRGYSNIHPYRLQLMKKSSINTVIDLNMAVMELMKNDIDKVFNFETSILKIVSTKNN
ncbi:hypothetical protein HMPREF1092_03226 [Clostridium thermobutyricum]|uniref:DNA polymerase III, delta subunit n=2 Tax=Clostridium thermobutyricum TaxID=29372 RepID=N9W8W4_9CLOT|nr:hypothetical protein [Clostridium thermobutyricum]ENY99485.1 hypothetical protein HMPREF1092_03226 [Clostridium thermobutyricum]